MSPTTYPEANRLLSDLATTVRRELGASLLGLYLYGSATGRQFNPIVSDVDVLAILTKSVDDHVFSALKRMHNSFENTHPEWLDRIEVQYVSAGALRTFKMRTSRIAAISPGDPFSYKLAGAGWTANWYDVQENGIALLGPPPATWIPRITRDEFLSAIAAYAAEVAARATSEPRHRGVEAYEVLTMCRALYSVRTGEQVSKDEAAAWAHREFPESSDVIATAVHYRNDYTPSHDPCDPITAAAMQSFVARLATLVSAADSLPRA